VDFEKPTPAGRQALTDRRDLPLDAAHASNRTANLILLGAMWLLGVTATQGRWIDHRFGSLRITLTLGLIFGALGWWRGVTHPVLRSYLRWAVPWFVIGLLSVLMAPPRSIFADTTGHTFDESIARLLWFLLIPGIAVVLQNKDQFRALVRGLISGAAIFLLDALYRAMQGQSALNRLNELLQTHRGIVGLTVVWVVPIVLTASFVRMRWLTRYLYVAGTVYWLFASDGRAPILALGVVPLAFFMLKPSKSGKPAGPRFAATAAAVFLIFFLASNVTISWAPALSRLSQVQGGNRTDSDEIRILLLKKAYTLTWKHPFTGVGFGRFAGTYDPIIDHARNEHVRDEALKLRAHNVYVETFAATGFLGGLLFIGTVLSPLALAIKYCWDRDLRAIAAGYCAIVFTMFFSADFAAVLYMAMAVLLAATVRVARMGPPPLVAPAEEPATV